MSKHTYIKEVHVMNRRSDIKFNRKLHCAVLHCIVKLTVM